MSCFFTTVKRLPNNAVQHVINFTECDDVFYAFDDVENKKMCINVRHLWQIKENEKFWELPFNFPEWSTFCHSDCYSCVSRAIYTLSDDQHSLFAFAYGNDPSDDLPTNQFYLYKINVYTKEHKKYVLDLETSHNVRYCTTCFMSKLYIPHEDDNKIQFCVLNHMFEKFCFEVDLVS